MKKRKSIFNALSAESQVQGTTAELHDLDRVESWAGDEIRESAAAEGGT
ncbi:hypothetical protein [Paenibacillus sp. JJ-223]|nr:hypothetical protein [Paenibacillus sp. JJ-223]CAH1191336.1 hypothetical protein PAECIP111890_00411 [Paenibacillus sp. JJ-223]